MFGRHLELSVVKNDKDGRMVDATPRMTPEELDRTAKRVIKYVVLGTVATFAAVITMNTASEIAVNRLSEPRKEDD